MLCISISGKFRHSAYVKFWLHEHWKGLQSLFMAYTVVNKETIIYCSLPKYAARLEHLSNSVTFPRLLKEELMLQIKLWSKKRRWMGSRKAPGFLLCYMFAVEIICSILMRVDISKNSPCHHFTTSCFSLISCGFLFFFFKVLS